MPEAEPRHIEKRRRLPRLGLYARIMLAAALSVAAVGGLFAWRLDARGRRTFVADRGATLTNRADWAAALFRGEVVALTRDVRLASRLPPVIGLMRAESGGGLEAGGGRDVVAWIERLRETFQAFASAVPTLTCMSFATVADGGRELVRLDVVRGELRFAPPDSLRQVRDAGYFAGARTLADGEVYLSPVERVSNPVEPGTRRVLRGSTKVTRADGSVFGVVMIEADVGAWIDATLAAAPPGVAGFMATSTGADLGRGDGAAASPALEWLVAGLDTDSGARWDALRWNDERHYVARARIVLDAGAPDGAVVLGYAMSEREVSARLAPLRRATIAGSAAVAVTLLAALGLIGFWALRPLRALRTAAERIGAGDYAVPLPEGDDTELGTLVTAFRRMRDGIRRRDEDARLATDALRENEARFRNTLDDMQEGCQIIGFDWRYLYVNDSAARHGRTTREALVGRTIMECYPGVEGTPLFQRLSACMTERTTQRLENEFVYPDGGRAWFDLVVMPSREGIFITSYDITTRKQAELEQRAAAARVVKQVEHLTLLDQLTRSIAERHDLGSICQAVVVRIEESLPVDVAGAFLYDEPRHVFRLNAVGARAAAASEAFLPGETIGIDANGLSRVLTGVVVYERDIADLDVPLARRLVAAGCRSVVLAPMRSESRVLGALVAARRAPDGFASTECEFLRQAAEHVALAVQHAELHTALRTAYDDLRQTQQSSMQLERMSAMAQMASGIAHDINNALSPVSLYAEVLLAQEHDLSARTREYLELIRHSVQGVAETVSRMREFARPQDRGRTPAPLRLNEIVQKAVTFTHARWGDLAQRQGVTIDVVTDLASGLPDVSGVESELRDALTNLIFNAIDAMPRGGTITLRTRLESPPGRGRPVVVVDVGDNGIGMDEATRLRCLEPFFTTKGDRGTGLGLAMVFGMVQRHGGQIEIESEPGVGSTFRIRLPADGLVQATPGAGSPEGVSPRGLRLLLVDDDPVLLRSLETTMEVDQHVVAAANGGAAGIAAFADALAAGRPFDAVITDLGMPAVDGRQVAAAVKEQAPATPVIMLTGWGRRLLADHEVPPHVDVVLSKPPTLDDIRRALGGLVRKPEGRTA